MVRTNACDLGPPGGFACERKACTTHNSPHKMAPQRPSPWPPSLSTASPSHSQEEEAMEETVGAAAFMGLAQECEMLPEHGSWGGRRHTPSICHVDVSCRLRLHSLGFHCHTAPIAIVFSQQPTPPPRFLFTLLLLGLARETFQESIKIDF